MKYLLLIATLVVTLNSCNNASQTKNKSDKKQVLNPVEGEVYGNKIANENIMMATTLHQQMADEDEMELKLEGNIEAVCQMSGCWMDMDLGDGEIVHVTFKDEAFTLPKDVTGKNAVIEGVTIRQEVPVAELKKAAKAEGKSQDEIDAINKPKVEYYFEADGVTLRK